MADVKSVPTVLANRNEPVPVVRLSDSGESRSGGPHEHESPGNRIFGHVNLQDRLLNSVFSHILPKDDTKSDEKNNSGSSSASVLERPQFSLQQMSANFRRFNSRIGIVFVFQNKIEHLLTWVEPTQTLSLLAVYTLLCLQPALFLSLPLALVFFFVMIPSFMVRHPPPPYSTASQAFQSSEQALSNEMESAWSTFGYASRPVEPPQKIKPAPSASKDFFRNMRDLQNCMEDFSQAHDAAVNLVTPYTDFSDERISSSTFLIIFILMCLSTVAAHLIPWRFIMIIAGWTAIINGHPQAQPFMKRIGQDATIKQFYNSSKIWLRASLDKDIVIDEPTEVREVEIYELQRRGLRGNKTRNHDLNHEADDNDRGWKAILFSTSPYDPLCHQRLTDTWPEGTETFEKVRPPHGWRWQDKKWALDLLPEAWVDERCITGVEVEREGGRWVYDLSTLEHKDQNQNTTPGNQIEWRRRRWIRMVERLVHKKA